jgi:hypothetical protein
VATGCFTTFAGMFCMLPSFFLVALGLFVRTLLWQPPQAGKSA